MLQYGIQPGDSIQIGDVTFLVEGDLLSSPGRAGIAASIAPVVFITSEWLDSTGLVQRGSRVDYQYFYKMPAGSDPDALVKGMDKELEKANLNSDTVESRKRSIGSAFGNFGTFLNLVGFIALLLGCIGSDPMNMTQRMTFGLLTLGDGINLVPLAIGPARILHQW